MKIKSFIKNYLLNRIDNLVLIGNSKYKKKSLLIIRLDAIGDYVLFRNFIEVLKKSEKYRNYRITLVGNITWKDLAEELDRDYIDKFIWINRNRFEKNLVYRFKKLKEITNQGYEIVINPTFSRTFYSDDAIVKIVSANEKIGSAGDLSNMEHWQKRISDKFYTKLIPAKREIIFEFYRNKEFFEGLLNEKINIKKPFINLPNKNLSLNLPQNYAILFIGASSRFKKWSIQNFVKIGKFLNTEFGYNIVLCGAKSDKEEAKEFRKYADYSYIDLVGKTTLIDLLYIINNGNLILSNETSAPHLAVSLGKRNIFVISNGNHFGRFAPYPKEIWQYYYPIYHPKIEKDLGNYNKLSSTYGYGSNLNINEITVEMVERKIKRVFSLPGEKCKKIEEESF